MNANLKRAVIPPFFVGGISSPCLNCSLLPRSAQCLDHHTAVFVRGFHDLYYEEASWPAIDAADFVERLCRILKSGGILGVVNCAAGSGVSVDVANTLHRIDPGIIRSDLISAGFEFVAESDVLRKKNDDRNRPISDPSVWGETDRVVVKFRKPAS